MDQETCPLPEDPTLAAAAVALNQSGQWVEVVDAQWRWVYSTDAVRLSSGFGLELVPFPLGMHYFGPAALEALLGWRTGRVALGMRREMLAAIGHWTLADTRGGREELFELVDPRLADIV